MPVNPADSMGVTWTPTIEQVQQAAAIGGWFLAHLPEAYGFEDRHRREYFQVAPLSLHGPDPRIPLRAALTDRLQAAFATDVLDAALPPFLCFPEATGLIAPTESRSGSGNGMWSANVHGCAVDLVMDYVTRHPTAAAVGLVGERLRYILMHPIGDTERSVSLFDLRSGYHTPGAWECGRLLLAWKDRPDARELLRAQATGAWRVPVEISGWPFQSPPAPVNSYQASPSAFDLVDRYLSVLAADGRLDYPTFCSVTEVFEGTRPWVSMSSLWNPPKPTDSPTAQTIRQFTRDYLRPLAADLASHVCDVSWYDWWGLEWLLAACRHIEREGIEVLPAVFTQPAFMIRSLAQIRGVDPGEESVAVAALREFSPRTLKAVLPHTSHASRFVLRALDWEALEALDEFTRATALKGFDGKRDAPNCADPESGVLDRSVILDVVGLAGEPLAREYLRLMRAAKVEASHTLMLVEAVMGWNRAAIEKGLKKEQQAALKAYGLLPVTDGDAEAADRYGRLKTIERASRKYGPERRLNTKAAVDAALSNLAQVAGYPDRVRLEWALEARRSATRTSLLGRHTIGDYDVELTVADEPLVSVSRNGKRLKAIPAAVKQDEQYEDIAAFVKEYRLHAARMRRSLENLMVSEEPLSAEDVASIGLMPAAVALLRSLVVRDATEAFGVFDSGRGKGEDLEGRPWRPTAPLIVAHPHHLHAAGRLDAAQGLIVRRRIVQPFKQVFRELYVPAPGESEASQTRRFAGATVDTKRATRLFEARQWRIRSSTSPCRSARSRRRASGRCSSSSTPGTTSPSWSRPRPTSSASPVHTAPSQSRRFRRSCSRKRCATPTSWCRRPRGPGTGRGPSKRLSGALTSAGRFAGSSG